MNFDTTTTDAGTLILESDNATCMVCSSWTSVMLKPSATPEEAQETLRAFSDMLPGLMAERNNSQQDQQ